MRRAGDEGDSAAFLELLEQRAPRPLAIQEMARILEIDHYDRKHIRAALEAEVARRKLRRIGKTRYQWLRERDRPVETARQRREPRAGTGSGRVVEGRYSRVRAGYGFVEVLGRSADFYRRDVLIPDGMEGAALHGDRVRVEIARRDPRLRRVVGRIVAVTGPVHERVIGTLERGRLGWVVIPENELLPPVDLIGGNLPVESERGLVALVRLTRPASERRPPGGELERVLGAHDDPDVQFYAIAYEHGLRIEFPPEAVEEAKSLPADPSEKDFIGRADLRRLAFVTIDGETARDFDDAVCLERMPDGGARLWVAIADVAHYVRPSSALDKEAALRGNSVYFPDRAIPMLPPELSTELCSLNPERERLVLVAELRYDREGRRRAADFYRAVIRSRARLTYTKVAAILSQAETPEIAAWRTELAPLLPELRDMRDLMAKLHRARVRAGSLDLDLPEALVDLSDEGRSVGLRFLERNDAHRLIEELMLEANRAVAEHLRAHELPLPYRIHEPPDPADVDDLNEFLGSFGLRVDYDERVEPRDVQRLLADLDGHRLSRVLSRQVLRSLKQAQYSTLNVGHFGLAFPIYCHFTSPIRRYPDLLVHRQLGRLFDGDLENARAAGEAIEAASVASSQTERAAMEAERAMLDLKKAEFMLGHLLEPGPGTIVSATSFGFFVELDAYPVEGLVRLDALTDDRYVFIEEERALRGLRRGQRFRLGDRLLVEATDVSLRRREIDFALIQRVGAPERHGAERSERERKPGRRGEHKRRPSRPPAGKRHGKKAGKAPRRGGRR